MIWKRKSSMNTIKEIVSSRLTDEDICISSVEPPIHNLDKAVQLTKECIEKGMPISIIGDYDCDGITSSDEMDLGITEYSGVRPKVIIPKRLSEGYGINMSIIDRIPCGLVITVDNGIAAVDQIAYAKEKGLTVIVIDHHLQRDDKKLPNADVIVDPAVFEEDSYKYYCGAGLAYRFIKALNPNSKILDKLITLAGIGTIADMMILKGHNRWIVKESLKNVASGNVPFGLKLLLEQMGIGSDVTEHDYGFQIGPTFNAAGRLYDDGGQRVANFIAVEESAVKTKADYELLKHEASFLIDINEERKAEVQKEMEIVDSILEETTPIIILQSDYFKKGIVGILAGKLTEKYHVPALVFTRDTKNPKIFTGSGRSPENLHLKNLLDKVSDLFIGYGGHAGAAGMSISEDNFELLKEKLNSFLCDYEPDDIDTEYYDLEINSIGQAIDYYDELRKYAPYGLGNPNIVFRYNGFNGVPKIMGKFKNHFKIEGPGLTVLGFHAEKKWKEEGSPTAIDVIGNLSRNIFNNTITPQIEMIDFHKKEEVMSDTYNDLASLFVF